jgi:hypothetical protein
MVPGNPPLSLEKTDRYHNDLRHWDAIYRLRAKTWGVFHACEPLFRELHHPLAVTETLMRDIFGKIPSTLNPPSITDAQLAKIRQLVAQKFRANQTR